ncbi:membrane-spanning 4-domains subfamily A member 15-like [Heteronotia binoei]|uniref:membrane-spanning 4-domains subfamily A member 15-like n=1 Tax=Heteronotia binoei TaxID=13085 RepID=UPI002930FC5C|nr:membrane-spanning 4-domains subfamily A member 15-like [Heteronotia binoei]
MDLERSGSKLPAQIGPQQPQLLADAGMSPSTTNPLKTFYKGEPLALGITQILIGVQVLAFGIMNNFLEGSYRPPYTLLKIPCWTGALFIISGSLAVAAAKKPRISLVKGMLGVNVVTAVAAGIGLLFFGTSLDEYLPWDSRWDHGCSDLNPEMYQNCYETKVISWILLHATIQQLYH